MMRWLLNNYTEKVNSYAGIDLSKNCRWDKGLSLLSHVLNQ